jgi:MFS family permease
MRAGDAEPKRGPGALLLDPVFGPFLGGKVISSCGLWMQNIAAAVLMFDLTGSSLMVGTVSVLQFTGIMTLSLWAGALTDRLDRRKLLLSGRIISGTAVLALALLLVIRGVDGFGGPPLLLVTVGVMGLGLALSAPAMQALVPGLVPARDLEQALALNSAAPSVARTVGPAMGAGLLLLGGPALAFAAAGVTHVLFAAALLAIKTPRHRQSEQRPSVLGGLRYLLSDRKAALLIIGIAMISWGMDPVVTLTPSLARQLGGSGEMVGVFASAFGAGAVVMTVLFRQLRQFLDLRRVGMLGFGLTGAGLVVVAFAPVVAVAAAGFFVSGIGFMMGTVSTNTRIQRRVPDELRGRVMALWGVAFLGSRPLAALANGWVADAVSLRWALLAAAAITLGSTSFASVSYSRADRRKG